MNDKVIEYDFGIFKAYFNEENSKSIFIPNDLIKDKEQIFMVNDFFASCSLPKAGISIYICINLTSMCNMKCKYCFNPSKKNESAKFTDIIVFIENIVSKHPESTKFFIDLSGSGEPLLEMDKIIKIAKYSKELQNRIGKEVLVQFICNGTLLNAQNVKKLQENDVLFGISLDGIKTYHDKNRIFPDGRGSFDVIMKNYLAIEHKDFIGVGMTYSCKDKPPLFDSYLFLDKNFNTLSCRIARSEEMTNEELDHLKNEYYKVAQYVIENLEKEDISFLKKMTNGDDYFGRYIIKVACEAYVNHRCDGGRERYSLGVDNKVYACSAGVNIEDMIINYHNPKKIVDKYERCSNCHIEHICGGECIINLLKNIDNSNLCNLKIFLFEMSLQICGIMSIYYPDLYCDFVNHISDVISRQQGDERLQKLYSQLKNRISFNKLKKIKDKKPLLFDLLFEKYVK